METEKLPALPFDEWTETRITVHLLLQILGKTRLKSTTRKNHWWYITLYVTPRGFGTYSIPINDGLDSFEMEFNIKRKAVIISQSSGKEIVLSLEDSPTIADFYTRFMGEINGIGVFPKFIDRPFDVGIDKSFNEITEYHHYDWKYINTFWKLMLWNNNVFKEFSGRFYGKTCPVHIYWHHLDLVVTRFSGKSSLLWINLRGFWKKKPIPMNKLALGFGWATIMYQNQCITPIPTLPLMG